MTLSNNSADPFLKNIFMIWTIILAINGYGSLRRPSTDNGFLTFITSLIRLLWSVWLTFFMWIQVVIDIFTVISGARKTTSQELILQMLGIASSVMSRVGWTTLMLIYHEWQDIVQDICRVCAPYLNTKTRKKLVCLVTVLCLIAVPRFWYFGYRSFYAFPFPADYSKNALIKMCARDPGCQNSHWQTVAAIVASVGIQMGRLTSGICGSTIEYFVPTLCLVLGISFRVLVREMVLQMRSLLEPRKGCGDFVGHYMQRYRVLEKIVRRLDKLLSVIVSAHYFGQALKLLDTLRPRKKGYLAVTVTEDYIISLYEHPLLIGLHACALIYLNEKAKSVIHVLEEIQAGDSDLDADQQLQVVGHVNRLATSNIGMTLAGIATVDRQFILSLIGVLASYMMILAELNKPDGKNNQAASDMSCEVIDTICLRSERDFNFNFSMVS
ncbi:uncharacterized protein LOC129589656 [Paramacrobiotus metropolitanus]|uniref:uncharacterized protein LOC129589656 n=1 Tax=Paramacrobiotus metropolitanus TaxID=2943436 RepID=UPI002445DB4A|nr:uncharacterized protein LOC129589656 [Paramacrobiotus metropolitanus]